MKAGKRPKTRRSGSIVRRLLGTTAQVEGLIHVLNLSHTAAAICQGGAPKRYRFTDRNEDAVMIREDGAGRLLLAVADAHGGAHASEIAVNDIAARPWWDLLAPSTTQWEKVALSALGEINSRILKHNKDVSTHSVTTLVVALLDLKGACFRGLSVGDSHLFLVDGTTTREVAIAPGKGEVFLGQRQETAVSLAQRSVMVEGDLQGVRAVILASDGVSTDGIGLPDPKGTVVECSSDLPVGLGTGIRSAFLAHAITRAAREAQRRHSSGDNIAVACAVLS